MIDDECRGKPRLFHGIAECRRNHFDHLINFRPQHWFNASAIVRRRWFNLSMHFGHMPGNTTPYRLHQQLCFGQWSSVAILVNQPIIECCQQFRCESVTMQQLEIQYFTFAVDQCFGIHTVNAYQHHFGIVVRWLHITCIVHIVDCRVIDAVGIERCAICRRCRRRRMNAADQFIRAAICESLRMEIVNNF